VEYFFHSTVGLEPIAEQTLGSELTASGGGKREASEWQRSANNEHAYRAMLLPGTATGGYIYFVPRDKMHIKSNRGAPRQQHPG